jgi:hypothetical protein
MCVPALTAWNVEESRADRQLEQLDQTRCLATVTCECEERAVLEEVVSVERRLPPLAFLFQKKTGSRYAPKTASIAALIS